MSAFTHAISTNNYGESKIIVSTSPANGTHTTLASALAAASVGDTVFLRDSVTEDVTLPPGVNIAAWNGSSLNTPTITGKVTMTGAGTSSISGIHLKTNSDYLIAVTGAAASILNVNNCYIEASNSSAINSTSSGGSRINLFNCRGDFGTTGIAYAVVTNGAVNFNKCMMSNSTNNTTSSTCSAGSINLQYSQFFNPITTSGTGGSGCRYSWIGLGAGVNTTALTFGGSGTHIVDDCIIESGTASAISIGGTAQIDRCSISSSNTNAVTGAGSIEHGILTFTGISSTINTTTQSATYSDLGKYRATKQPAFLAYLGSTVNNVTGNGTTFTLGTTTALTEIVDQGSNFTTAGTFTAPKTGLFILGVSWRAGGFVSSTNGSLTIVTSNRTYSIISQNPVNVSSSGQGWKPSNSILADMDEGDTATFTIIVTGEASDVVDIIGGASPTTFCFGYQTC